MVLVTVWKFKFYKEDFTDGLSFPLCGTGITAWPRKQTTHSTQLITEQSNSANTGTLKQGLPVFNCLVSVNLLKLHTETEYDVVSQYSSSLFPFSYSPFDFTSTLEFLSPPPSLSCLTDSSAPGLSSLAERVPWWWNSIANCSCPLSSSFPFPMT